MTGTVEIHDDVAAVPDWDDLAADSGAPVFYRSAFLSAYRESRLLPADAYAYLVLRDADRRARAALPVALLPRMDPLGALAVYEPSIATERGLISHTWHCYDTWLPSREGPADLDAVRTVLAAFQSLAAELSAPWYGLVNVDATGPLAAALTGLGAHGVPIDQRYVLDLPPGFDPADHLAALPGHQRYTLSLHRRRAERAGAVTRILEPGRGQPAAHDGLVASMEAGYFAPGGLHRLHRLLGPAARIIEVCVSGRVVGLGICLLDERSLHLWTCAADRSADEFSPFYVLFYEALKYAARLGVTRFECGRRYGEFKRRCGLRPVPLLAYVAPTHRPLDPSAR
ncbi:GNAT family N-acetyltransferase [Actinocrinis puniceicyclus]|uniref:GNAT family N-acetyltransferase n=1 Tax=Actinocrinis puniceicyclus TaxID=977794 RepID=A0A8J8BEI6_9ACTN|nr:GNAT family N-acetyltransferase [Actinocrinis puniceicyclus]MBS2963789.1 GNAT family N-acetyltransferase [Actinocrinis puniceicyclus]